jgi:hypothetical protein
MTKTVADKLSDLVEAVKALPAATLEALVEAFSDRLSDFNDDGMTEAQRNEVARRLVNPRRADADDVRRFFARYGVKSP